MCSGRVSIYVKSAGTPGFLVSLAVFAAFSAVAGAGFLLPLDLWMVGVAQSRTPEALDAAGRAFSWLGDLEVTAVALLMICAALLRQGRRRPAWRLVAAFVLTGLLEVAMKFLLPVPPIPEHVSRSTDPSPIVEVDYPYPYPSGHVLRITLVAGAAAALRPGNRLALLCAGALIAGMAATRVYLGVHWFSDVAGGALLGAAGLAWAFARDGKEGGKE